jgi:uncharacterized protein YndB with AHSA1/START domain
LPEYAARRTLQAGAEDVWAVVSDPDRLAAWWPDVARVDPGRRGLVPGARWQLEGTNRPHHLRRHEPTGTLFVLEVEPQRRVSFQLTGDRIDVELELVPLDDGRTDATLTVGVPWLVGVGRRFPQRVLERLDRAL